MEKSIRICMIGCGAFARHFVPLFKSHPAVEKVAVCDLIPERAAIFQRDFDVPVVESFEKAIHDPEINAIGIFVERHLHGPLVIQALKAGKNVYSAVPCSISIDDIFEIEKLVRETRLIYSMGETGFYRAATVFCREQFKKGAFGEFVYGEAQYNHDIRNMEGSFRRGGGDNWRAFAGIPPFFYPTHSTAMILGSMPGVYATKVSAQGYEPVNNRADIFGTDGQNNYNNPFGNTAMLMKLSNGGVARISENRIVGWKSPETFISQFYGHEGCYEFSVATHYMAQWDPASKDESGLPKKVKMTCVNDQLLPVSVNAKLKENFAEGIQEIADGAGFWEASPIQPTERLPKEFEGLNNGHNGTHQLMVDDFCRAMTTGKLTPTNIWQVARFNLPGLVAHQSALQGGVLMDVPDLGNPPEDWPVLDPRTGE